jgi:hypothetical protein
MSHCSLPGILSSEFSCFTAAYLQKLRVKIDVAAQRYVNVDH